MIERVLYEAALMLLQLALFAAGYLVLHHVASFDDPWAVGIALLAAVGGSGWERFDG